MAQRYGLHSTNFIGMDRKILGLEMVGVKSLWFALNNGLCPVDFYKIYLEARVFIDKKKV